MRDNPVDVLIVDEAGQLGLADTLAASISATNVILLGDPQQLPQVAQASHPNRSGVSALEHLLGEGDRTFPPDRGVLLDVTWRMHPDVCGFISDVMYEGKLTSEADRARARPPAPAPACAGSAPSTTAAPPSHPRRQRSSPPRSRACMGTDWTDQRRHHPPAHRRRLHRGHPLQRPAPPASTRALDGQTRRPPGVEVGTVDKFQGREAAVVLFSMATSSAEFMPRDADFLFSKNRLNVAISRARCLAYLICTDELLDTRASRRRRDDTDLRAVRVRRTRPHALASASPCTAQGSRRSRQSLAGPFGTKVTSAVDLKSSHHLNLCRCA